MILSWEVSTKVKSSSLLFKQIKTLHYHSVFVGKLTLYLEKYAMNPQPISLCLIDLTSTAV